MTSDLLLVEDLFLVLAEDESGTPKGAGTLYYTLGGAVLVELAQRGLVEVNDKKRVRVIEGADESDGGGNAALDPLLADALEKVRKRGEGSVQTALIDIGTPLHKTVPERLVERGYLAEEKSRWLGFIPVTKRPAQNLEYEGSLIEDMRAALEDEAVPTERTAALIALVSASGTLPEFYKDIEWSGKVARRAKQFEDGDWAAAGVGSAIVQHTIAIAATTVAISVSTAAAIAP